MNKFGRKLGLLLFQMPELSIVENGGGKGTSSKGSGGNLHRWTQLNTIATVSDLPGLLLLVVLAVQCAVDYQATLAKYGRVGNP